jgi:cation diffusion facilitator family transporter
MQSPARKITLIGMFINMLLVLGKVTSGILCKSQTILADGLHSASDFVTDLLVLWGLKFSSTPADSDHHFGHMRYSTVVALFLGILLFLAGLWIVVEAVLTVSETHSEIKPFWPFFFALLSIFAKEWLYRATKRVGEAIKDPSLVANAWHHRSDALSSIGAAIGLLVVMVGGDDFGFVDHVAAGLIGAYLCYIAGGIVRTNAKELLDEAPDSKTIEKIEEVVRTTSGVKGFHSLRARKMGGKVSMDVHVLIDPEMSMKDGHEVANRVEARIKNADLDVLHVVVHLEPADHTE